METFSRIPLRLRILLVSLLLLGATLILDYLFFQRIFLALPNEVEWGESPWYNFAHRANELQENADKANNRVLILGSSVALFSVLPETLNSNADGLWQFSFLSHVAMAPTDAYYYLPYILSAKPKQVFYFLNFGDLQWEHTKISGDIVQFDEDSWRVDFALRNPAKVFYPRAFLKDHYSGLSKKTNLTLLSKSLLNVNRIRSFFLHPMEAWIENHLRGGRSFSQYQGSMPVEGVWARGWVGPVASMECDSPSFEKNSIFVPGKNSSIRAILSESKEQDSPIEIDLSFSESGWQRIADNSEFEIKTKEILERNKQIFLKLVLKTPPYESRSLDFAPYGKSYPIGFRLSQGFCKSNPDYRNQSYIRRNYFEDTRLESMRDSEYDEEYVQRFETDKEARPALGRLNLLNQRKREVNNFTFETNPEIERALHLVQSLEKNGIQTTLILSPDNPLESKLYSEGLWFKGFKAHLQKEVQSTGGDFADWTNAIPRKQLFLDPHHLTYKGAGILSYKLLEFMRNRKEKERINQK